MDTPNQLLFDDALVEDKRGFTLTLKAPAKADVPALLPERPWEAKGIHGVCLVEGEGGRQLMYYGATGKEGKGSLCLAISSDGIVWERPDLGVVDYNDSRDNNMVLPGVAGTVFHDPQAPAQEQFKLIGADNTRWGVTSVNGGGARFRYFKGELETWEYRAVIGAHSADGIHWTKYPEPVMPWYTDTVNVAFWDDRISRYVAYVRLNEHLAIDETGQQVGSFDYRTVARAETEDFARFPAPVKIVEPDFTSTEDQDMAGGGLYNSAAIKYGNAADSYFIFPSAPHHTSDTLDIHLATSRDGIHFDRWTEPFVRLGASGQFDSKGCTWAPG